MNVTVTNHKGGCGKSTTAVHVAAYLVREFGEGSVVLVDWKAGKTLASLPLRGEPAEVVTRIETFDAWLAKSTEVPKLLLTFEGSPTLGITGETTAWCAENMASLEIVPCGEAGHHAAEDRPTEIGDAIAA